MAGRGAVLSADHSWPEDAGRRRSPRGARCASGSTACCRPTPSARTRSISIAGTDCDTPSRTCFLDPALQREAGSPWPELSRPLYAVAALSLRAARVVIVENKVNLLTLPSSAGGVALGGLENAVTDLRDVPWLQASDVLYWGDLDVDGFAILSRLRTMLPHVRSLMMDRRTLEHWRERLAVRGTGGPAPLPPGLTVEEAEAFRICAAEDLRIEQERLPQPYVRAAITDP